MALMLLQGLNGSSDCTVHLRALFLAPVLRAVSAPLSDPSPRLQRLTQPWSEVHLKIKALCSLFSDPRPGSSCSFFLRPKVEIL